jgi:hypothetical protein
LIFWLQTKKTPLLLEQTKEYALEYMRTILSRSVVPDAESVEKLSIFQEPLNDGYGDMHEIIERLHRYGSPATVAQTGDRYFGFVNGGIIPASLAAKWLTDVWDRIPRCMSCPCGVPYWKEYVKSGWRAIWFSFRHCRRLCCRQFLRYALRSCRGEKTYFWNRQVMMQVKKACSEHRRFELSWGKARIRPFTNPCLFLGLGSGRVTRVPQDEQGRIRTDAVPALDDRTLLILQAGNVNTGSFDHFDELCLKARDAGAWVHIDGAFGLWAAASEKLKCLTKGIEHAHSWSLDAHKSLNAPYDCGIIMCSDRAALANALHMTGSYLVFSEQRDNMLYTIDMSRRARAVELWASLKSLGKRESLS